jgi:cytochrome c55X
MKHSVVIFWFLSAVSAIGSAVANDIDPHRRNALVQLVRQDCGSCHGLTLKGGLGPALLPADLKDKPPDYLKWIILQGRPDSAMPPWNRFLSEAEAEWIALHLQKGFPDAP